MTTRWVTAAALQALYDQAKVAGGSFTATQLAEWTAKSLTAEQRVHASSRLCALRFVAHSVVIIDGLREDLYTVTPDGRAAIEAAGQGHVRKSGPKGQRAPNPVRPDALASRLWALVRLRRIIETDTAASTLCDAGTDYQRVRATVARTLRRWELAGALQAASRLIKRRDDKPQSNGSKRYVLVSDSVEPPRWRPVLGALAANRDAQEGSS